MPVLFVCTKKDRTALGGFTRQVALNEAIELLGLGPDIGDAPIENTLEFQSSTTFPFIAGPARVSGTPHTAPLLYQQDFFPG